MKSVFLSILLCFPLFWSSQSVITINGKTNINTFKCTNSNFQKYAESVSFSGRRSTLIPLAVNDFDCNNRMMTSDFRKTLNASAFPKMYVHILKVERSSADLYRATVEVTITDKSKTYDVDFVRQDKVLVGKRNVKFSDFNIVPPRRMGGMVVVNDNLGLDFRLAH